MGYTDFKEAPKALTKSEDIGAGQIQLSHLSAAVFSELRQIALHNHSGSKSRRINLRDLGGAFSKTGFYMYDVNSARYHITISGGAFVLTAG